ncbi:transcriptional regulator, AraC family [Gloeothece citriformis PCC 7424]|uniref:Transcriptional regulator, AraC family n=1 Tax=Gloeothece citriformis (strain PCC 7424) TaxID=65393 RepID=B7K972_GLOC7|nr:AraC family transcriptional regulator [Gloeothece citriformis]ACK68555.1 transcriptional regulator, AraC family [Gloeothece citriformis PCC 7424]
MSKQFSEDNFSNNNQSFNLYPQLPLFFNTQADWNEISLEYHIQPPGETPEFVLSHHTISINVGQNVQIERMIDGHLQSKVMFTGAVSFCPMALPHAIRWDTKAEILLLNLEDRLLSDNALELLNTDEIEIIPYHAIEDPLIQQMGLALRREFQSGQSDSKLYAQTMANALAVHLLRHYSTRGNKARTYTNKLPQHQLKLVKDYINDNLERSLCLHELAGLTQLSPYHFCRVFKQSIGKSPYQYVIQCRVERAKQLLKQSKLNLAEIAIVCGFAHQSHLCRHFKRLTGVTPKAFLKS